MFDIGLFQKKNIIIIKYNKFQDNIDQINEISNIARKRNVAHLYTEDDRLEGRYFTIRGKKTLNFGSCSYLGLETDPRLKSAAVQAIEKYGTQFSSSRTYVSFTLYKELEALLSNIFDHPVIYIIHYVFGPSSRNSHYYSGR